MTVAASSIMSSEPPRLGSAPRGSRSDRTRREKRKPSDASSSAGVQRGRSRNPAPKAVPRDEAVHCAIVDLPDALPVCTRELEVLERYLGSLIDQILDG
ncbi:hypothetical protein [Aureimonas sp. AU20]|uniref:hypothetical protein n=1 Tax=Aureimonas sp. AU20 TaxID=1349819 RepID=UPI0012E3C49C|nr:hypothetical protein [Aureimonas sp. AU20]